MDPQHQQQFSIPMDPLFPASSISPIFSTTTIHPPQNHHLPHLPTTSIHHTAPPNLPQHPPYEDMITTAIVALNESEGSSKQAISKYIDRVFNDLPPNHSEMLTYHMKRLKNSGQVVLYKRSYMLPSRSAPAPPPSSASGISSVQNVGSVQYDYQNYYDVPVGMNQGEKQGSAALPVVPNNIVQSNEGNGGISGSEAMLVSLGLSDEPSVEVTQTKKPRGRPKSASAMPGVGQTMVESGVGQGMMESGVGKDMQGLVAQSGPKRRPGRPRKNESSVAPAAPGVFPVQVPVGAPVPATATAPASFTGRARGRPKRYADESAVPVSAAPKGTLGGKQQPKKRGRKPKNAGLMVVSSADPVSMVIPNQGINSGAFMIPQQYTVVSSNGVASLHPVASNGLTQVPSGKRRGRPPGGGKLKKRRKPPGRPRKNPSGPLGSPNLENSQSLIVQKLKTKLDYLQSKIRENVSIIKLSVNMETSVNALGALEHLEELANMEF